jgi:small subunit ribosomal protein S6
LSVTKYYECMFLLDSGKYAADAEGTIEYVLNVITKAGGEIAVHRPWQDGKLAYGIRVGNTVHRKGLHYLVCFTSESSTTIDEITYTCRVAQEGIVLRHLTVAHPKSLFDPLVASLGSGEGFAHLDDEEEEVVASAVDDDIDDIESEEEEEVTSDL